MDLQEASDNLEARIGDIRGDNDAETLSAYAQMRIAMSLEEISEHLEGIRAELAIARQGSDASVRKVKMTGM